MGAPRTHESTCPACGQPVYPDDGFCEACGHRLDGSAGGTAAPACPGCGATTISADGYCDHCGLRQPAAGDHVEIRAASAAGVSDRGVRHSHNEDAMALVRAGQGVAAVVSDGVSTSARPESASRIAADTGVAALAELLGAGATPEAATRTALARAADAVAALGPDGRSRDRGAGSGPAPGPASEPATEPASESASEAPSCTYVSALTGADSVTVGWVGDSRAYWLANGGGVRLTEDDSWAVRMVTAGAMSEAEAQAHPNAHVITGWLGADAGELDPHVRTFTPDGPGVVLVCSDGLWNYLPEPADLAAAAPGAASDPMTAARSLTRLALDAGGRDNITVVVIPFPSPVHPTQEQAE